MKKCYKCDKNLELNDFHKDRSQIDGLQRYCKYCRAIYRKEYMTSNPEVVAKLKLTAHNTYRKKYQANKILDHSSSGYILTRKWMTHNKRYVIEDKGKRGKCDKCGYNKYYSLLHYHHKDSSTKSFDLSRVNAQLTLEQVQAEINKCLLLCPTCHAEEHLMGKNKKSSV